MSAVSNDNRDNDDNNHNDDDDDDDDDIFVTFHFNWPEHKEFQFPNERQNFCQSNRFTGALRI